MEPLKLCRSKQRADRDPQRTLIRHSTMPMLHTTHNHPNINQSFAFYFIRKLENYLSNGISNPIYARFWKRSPVVPHQLVVNRKLNRTIWERKSFRIEKNLRRNFNSPAYRGRCVCRRGDPFRRVDGEKSRRIWLRRRFHP